MKWIECRQEDVFILAQYLDQVLYKNFKLETLLVDGVDLHVALYDKCKILARASLWWNKVPMDANNTLGLIGHFEAIDESVATALLNHCFGILIQKGCTLAVGPMNGSTWKSYRYVTKDFGMPAFLLEPTHPKEYPDFFVKAGFSPYKQYISTLEEVISDSDPRFDKTYLQLQEKGVRIRNFQNQDFIQDMRAIFQVSLVSFVHNPLYIPIDEASFIAQYKVFEGKIIEPLVLIAEEGEKPVGFMFSYPNMINTTQIVSEVVLKTLAVLPDRKYAGLGMVLTEITRKHALQLGFSKAIYALMYQGNKSMNIAKKNQTVPMREYTLFAKRISS